MNLTIEENQDATEIEWSEVFPVNEESGGQKQQEVGFKGKVYSRVELFLII